MAEVGVWEITRWDESTWSEQSVPYDPLITGYTALVDAVIDLLKDDDVTAQPSIAERFIRLAHDKLQRDLIDEKYGGQAPRQMLARASSTTNDQSEVTLPNDLVTLLSVNVNDLPLRYRSPEKVPTGVPGWGETDVTIEYYYRIPLISPQNPDNWLLDIAADCYLYGAALQYVPWAQEPAVLGLWQGFYQDAVAGVRATYDRQPRGHLTRVKGRPYRGMYTVIGNALHLGGGYRGAW